MIRIRTVSEGRAWKGTCGQMGTSDWKAPSFKAVHLSFLADTWALLQTRKLTSAHQTLQHCPGGKHKTNAVQEKLALFVPFSSAIETAELGRPLFKSTAMCFVMDV
jgi:hypothetical protein